MLKTLFRRPGPETAPDLVELVELEREAHPYRFGDFDAVEDLSARFGVDERETRVMSHDLRRAVHLARDLGRWADAVVLFRRERTRQPDFDVPRLWQVEFLAAHRRTLAAIALAKAGARSCRRKSALLAVAGELALSVHDVRGAVHLLAQSVAALDRRPEPGEVAVHRALLFLAELLEVFGDEAGARWARRGGHRTSLEPALLDLVRVAALRVPDRERDRIVAELPWITGQLRART